MKTRHGFQRNSHFHNEGHRAMTTVCNATFAIVLLALLLLPRNAEAQNKISYQYDSAGRLSKVIYADSSTLEYTYDKNGNILTLKGVPKQQNLAPTATSASITTPEDVTASATPNVTDPNDGDTHTFAIVTQPANGVASVVAGELQYAPKKDFNGSDSFTYRATDQGGLNVTGTCAVTVTPVNDAPVAKNDSVTAFEDTPKTFDPKGNDTDIDGGALTVQSVNQPANGATTVVGDSIQYSPATGFEGSDMFDYVISDGNGGLDTATVFVTVNPKTGLPIAVDDNAVTDEDVAVTIDVIANDNDGAGSGLTVTGATTPANGSAVVLPSNQVEYTPNKDYNGNDTFQYTIRDGNSQTATATVTVTINPVNDQPGIFTRTQPVDNATETNPVTFAWTQADDPDGDVVNYEINIFVAGKDTSLTVSTLTASVDFKGLALPDGQHAVSWSILATDGATTQQPDNGDGNFTLDYATVAIEQVTAAGSFTLGQNYPNPFSASESSVIPFSLERGGRVALTIHDALGRKVATILDEHRAPGMHDATIQTESLPAGSYYFRLSFGGKSLTRSMQIVR